MRRRKDRSNSSRVPVTVNHRKTVRNPVRIHRAEAAPAVVLQVKLPARR